MFVLSFDLPIHIASDFGLFSAPFIFKTKFFGILFSILFYSKPFVSHIVMTSYVVGFSAIYCSILCLRLMAGFASSSTSNVVVCIFFHYSKCVVVAVVSFETMTINISICTPTIVLP
ncbi:hypothetical protein C8Q75DRAFT_364087 [Abortiporus biennis]|nr:hypothetical protein C8Q75DRAFT_364087 [Abortiporus biennis]